MNYAPIKKLMAALGYNTSEGDDFAARDHSVFRDFVHHELGVASHLAHELLNDAEALEVKIKTTLGHLFETTSDDSAQQAEQARLQAEAETQRIAAEQAAQAEEAQRLAEEQQATEQARLQAEAEAQLRAAAEAEAQRVANEQAANQGQQ